MGHLLVMTNHHTMSEDPWAMRSLVIDWTRFVYRLTDMGKAIYPLFFKGGHNNKTGQTSDLVQGHGKRQRSWNFTN